MHGENYRNEPKIDAKHMHRNISDTFRELEKFKDRKVFDNVQISGEDPSQLRITFDHGPDKDFSIESMKRGDESKLLEFRDQLSDRSRDLFCPYPWENEAAFRKAIDKALTNSEERIDALYTIEHSQKPIGHFFLWKAYHDEVDPKPHIPELGVAIADAYHGKGLGLLSVKLLQAIARSLKADAIELTTAPTNDAGWSMYQKSGFEHIGDIHNPLETNVTDVAAGKGHAEKYRVERQMVYIINEEKREEILKTLEQKRALLNTQQNI